MTTDADDAVVLNFWEQDILHRVPVSWGAVALTSGFDSPLNVSLPIGHLGRLTMNTKGQAPAFHELCSTLRRCRGQAPSATGD